MNTKRSMLSIVMGLALIAGGAGAASAQAWDQRHPRRAEVNHRIENQGDRIRSDLKSGRITHVQAARLRRDDRLVRAQERFDASFDNSHITRAEQRSLNQNENAIGRRIYRDAH